MLSAGSRRSDKTRTDALTLNLPHRIPPLCLSRRTLIILNKPSTAQLTIRNPCFLARGIGASPHHHIPALWAGEGGSSHRPPGAEQGLPRARPRGDALGNGISPRPDRRSPSSALGAARG